MPHTSQRVSYFFLLANAIYILFLYVFQAGRCHLHTISGRCHFFFPCGYAPSIRSLSVKSTSFILPCSRVPESPRGELLYVSGPPVFEATSWMIFNHLALEGKRVCGHEFHESITREMVLGLLPLPGCTLHRKKA